MNDQKKAEAENAGAPDTTAPVEQPAAQSLTPESLEAQVAANRQADTISKQAETIAQLREEVANLRNQISIATQGAGVPGHLAAMVAEKMRAGLSREDAIEVSTKQIAHDAEVLKQEKLAEEAKKRAAAEKAKADKAAAPTQAPKR